MTKVLNSQQNLLYSNPYLYFKNLKHATRRLTELLISLLQKYETLYISQQSLADMVGISRCYCSTLLNKLERDGVIVIKNRWNTSNIYRLTSFVMRNDILRSVSKAMAIFSNYLDKTFQSIKKKLTLSIDSLFINMGLGSKDKLSQADCVQLNSFLTPKQEKFENNLIWFEKGDRRMLGQEDQTDFYASLGYERVGV